MEPSARRLTIGIDLDSGTQPVSGTLSPESGQPIAFSGWIELVAALREQIVEADESDAYTEEATSA